MRRAGRPTVRICALSVAGRFEPAHDLLPFPCRAVGILNPVIQSLVSAMIGRRSKGLNRSGVAAQLVGHHNPGLAVLRDQSAKETFGRFAIPAGLNQDIEHVSIAVNCPPKPEFHSAIDDHDFIQMPFCIGFWSVPVDAAREVPARSVHPFADWFPADTDTPLRQEVFNICRTQRKPMIRPNGVGNDRSRKTEALEARQIEMLKHHSDLPKPITSNKLAMPFRLLIRLSHFLGSQSIKLALLEVDSSNNKPLPFAALPTRS